MHDRQAARDDHGLTAGGADPAALTVVDSQISTTARREMLRRAIAGVHRAGHGHVVDLGVGFDPEPVDQLRPFWARAKMTGGRVVETITVEGHETAPDALDALAVQVRALVRARQA